MKKFLKKKLLILPGLVIMLALAAAPAFALDRPTWSTPLPAPAEVDSITIGGETTYYEQDNNGPAKFIRAVVPTEYDLKHTTVVVNLKSAGTDVDSPDLVFEGSGATRTATDVNLFNQAYEVTIGGATYILAAQLPEGPTFGVSPDDPLKVEEVALDSEPASVYGRILPGLRASQFPGNPYYVQEGLDWTAVNYFVTVDLASVPFNRADVPGTMLKNIYAAISGCAENTGGDNYSFDLSTAVPNFTVTCGGEERTYYVFASVPGDVEVTFGFDFTEALDYGGAVKTKAESIRRDLREYLGTHPVDGPDYVTISVPSGLTVMDLLEDFTNAMDYPDKTTGSSYISSINGLQDFDGGPLSRWRYMDGPYTPACEVPMISAGDYRLTSKRFITWFYTTDYIFHYNPEGWPRPAPVLTGSCAADQVAARDTSQAPGQSFHADPIDTATGAHVLERTLLAQQGAMAFDLQLSYNSLLLNEGPLGKGWSHNYEASIEQTGGDLNLRWNANRKNTFVYAGSNQYISNDTATRYDKITRQPDGSYILLRKDQSRYLFNPAGKLTTIQNGRGQQLDLAYTAGKLASVTEPASGMALTFTYNASGLLETVTDTLSRQTGFTYDAGHNLTVITDPDNQTITYTYNSEGRVLTATDSDNVRLFSNIYDVYGRVVVQDDAVSGNEVTTFWYEETTSPERIITTVTDRNGNQRVLTHDGKYQLLEVTDELGHSASYTYDENGNKLSETNAKGLTTEYTYDGRGNLLTVTDPEDNVTTMTYDANNNLLTLTNPAQKTVTNTYDSNNNLLTVTDPLQNTTAYTYENGLLKTRTSPGQGVITYSYQNSLLQNTVNEEGYTLTYNYDDAGRLLTVTDGAGKTTSFTYDPNDNLLTQTDPLGNTVTYTYDCLGNKLTATDPNGNTTTYTYSGNSKLISLIDALDNETTYEYDGEDRLILITDARGNTTTQILDAKGRTVGVTDALDNTVSMEYDELDNLTVRKDAYGREILTTTYDNLNNPVTQTDALGNTTTNVYDNLSRLISQTDPLERLAQYAYDDLNRLTAVTDPLSGVSSQSFDADGNRTTLVDPGSNQLTYTHDHLGRVTDQTSTAGRTITYEYDSLRNLLTSLTNGRDQETTYQYDAAGRLLSYTGPEGSCSYTYDDNGNILSQTDAAGTLSYEYDELSRVTEYTDIYDNTLQYEYDEVGNPITLTYPDDQTVHYEYDANNRLIQVTDWENRTTSYTYDNNGRLKTTTRPDGSDETRTYDAAGQLLRIRDIKADETLINQLDYTYDAAGNLTAETRTDPAGTVSYEYDELNRMTEYTDVYSNTLQYDYDEAGNITAETSLQPPGSTVMTYGADNRLDTYNGQPVAYDDDGNMTQGPLAGDMVDFTFDSRSRLTGAGDTSYTYDANNNRVSVSDSVYQTSYTVNPNATLSQVLTATDESDNKTYFVYGLGLIGHESADGSYRTYHFDHLGSTIVLTDETGSVTDRFQYAPYGELVNHTGSASTPFLFNGQYGVMTDESDLYYMRARYYNPIAKRFLSPDTLVGQISNTQSQNRYVYCEGNPANYVDPTGHKLKLTDKSAENNQVIFDYLQSLTDNKLVVNDGEVRISEYASGTSKKNGDYLIWKIIISNKTCSIKISPAEKGDITYYRPVLALIGIKLSSDISFNPGYNPDLPIINPATGRAYLEPVPSNIALGHELIHSYRLMYGMHNPGGLEKHTYINSDGMQVTEWSPVEEYETVGIDGYTSCDVTENLLRAEHGLNLRGGYQSWIRSNTVK